MPAPLPEQIGRFRITNRLGGGGMGTVYLAWDPTLERRVAIKVMKTSVENDDVRERFYREARSAGRLQHPGIVTVFDVGEANGEPFIAMEYVEGETLTQVIDASQTGSDLPVARKLTLIDDLCKAVHYAHGQRIIHRDIKPANIMVSTVGVLKVLDFGIARIAESTGLTQASKLLGTLNYMAPEQYSSKRIDHRVDIFAIGAVFYELLSGKRAFPGETSAGVMHAILFGEQVPLRELVPSLDPGIISIVSRCLARSADDRYPDLEAMRRDLTYVRRQHAPDADPLEPAASDPDRTFIDTSAREDRARDLDQLLDKARKAIAAERWVDAKAACHQAQALDPQNAAARELRGRIEDYEHALEWINSAQHHVQLGAITTAESLVKRALAKYPSLPKAVEVQASIADARRRRDDDQRARLLQETIQKGRRALDAGTLEPADAAADAALAMAPQHPDARALKHDVAARRDALKRAAELSGAEKVLIEGRAMFARGEHQAAIDLLKRHRPEHQIVRSAIVALEDEQRQIRAREETNRREEQRRRDEDARRRQEEVRRKEEARQEEEARRQRQADLEQAVREDEARRQELLRREQEMRREPVAPAPAPVDRRPDAPAPVPPPPAPRRRTALIAGIAVALLAVAAVIWGAWPRSQPPTSLTSVLIDIKPWARIESITRAGDGGAVPIPETTTPSVLALAPGEYHVRVSNPFFPQGLEFDVRVEAGAYQEIRRALPNLNPEDEFKKLLEGR